jgi:hypothetical protein
MHKVASTAINLAKQVHSVLALALADSGPPQLARLDLVGVLLEAVFSAVGRARLHSLVDLQPRPVSVRQLLADYSFRSLPALVFSEVQRLHQLLQQVVCLELLGLQVGLAVAQQALDLEQTLPLGLTRRKTNNSVDLDLVLQVDLVAEEQQEVGYSVGVLHQLHLAKLLRQARLEASLDSKINSSNSNNNSSNNKAKLEEVFSADLVNRISSRNLVASLQVQTLQLELDFSGNNNSNNQLNSKRAVFLVELLLNNRGDFLARNRPCLVSSADLPLAPEVVYSVGNNNNNSLLKGPAFLDQPTNKMVAFSATNLL